MARIFDASDIEPVSARTMRAPGAGASGDDFGAATGEALAGLAEAGLRLARTAARSRQPAEDDAFVTAGMAEGRRHFTRIDDDGQGNDDAPEAIDRALSEEIPTLIEELRSAGRFEPSPQAVKELTSRLSALKGVSSVRNAVRAHRARRDRHAADLEASMRTFAEAASDNPDHLDDVLADARDAIGRAERHFPGSAARLREAYEPAIVEAAVGGWTARDPEMAVELLEAGAYDTELPPDRKAALLAEAEAARDQGRMVARAAILGSLEDHLEDLAAGGSGIPGLGTRAAEVLDEADTADFEDREEIIRATYDTIAKYRYAPAPKLIAELDRHRPKPGERPSPAGQRKFEILEREAGRLLAERRQDGAAYVMGMPAVRAVFEAAVPLPVTGVPVAAGIAARPDPGAVQRALSVRWDIQGEIGLGEDERRVLTRDEASETAGQLQAAEPAKLIAQVADYNDRYGKHLPKALDELVAAGLDPRVTVLIGAATKPALANALARVIATGNIELRKGIPDPDVAAIRNGIRGRLDAIAPPAGQDQDDDPSHLDGLGPMAEGLALTYYRQTGDVNTSVTRTTKELVPNARTLEWRPGEDSPDAARTLELLPKDMIPKSLD